jgi:RNA-binding protein 26
MYGTPGGEIPSVGKVELAWVQTPLPPVNLSSKTNVGKSENADDTPMDEGDAMAAASSPAHAMHHGQEQQENIDYDVADDNDWGPE